MAAQSQMLPLGTAAPAFRLPDPASGESVGLSDFVGAPALLIAFLCNHCPYVKNILDAFVAFAREYDARGLAIVAVSSNDIDEYPADSPDEMAKLSRARGFTFPYLFDGSQSVAKAYGAVCTPEFFLFDQDRRLVYRGQFDNSRPGSKIPATGAHLRAAADAVLARSAVSPEQIPSVGCSIKWKKGHAP
jgi:peroxiredoxin